MKKITILVLVLLVFLLTLTGCFELLDSATGLEDIRKNSEGVKTYPVNLKGSATISRPQWNGNNCTMAAQAEFIARDDQTCRLRIAFPMTWMDINGKCVPNGDTEVWLLQGRFDKAEQKCRFESCNDRPDNFSASGIISFNQSRTWWATASCKWVKDGAIAATVEVKDLQP